MAVVLEFPREACGHWPLVRESIEVAAKAFGLSAEATSDLVRLMRKDWDEYLGQVQVSISREDVQLDDALSSSRVQIEALVSGVAKEVGDKVWLRMLGLYQVLVWERASILAQGALCLSQR